MATRTERDTMGAVEVPADRYWGAQTARSLDNFRIGTERMPREMIRALGLVKKAAALANAEVGVLGHFRSTIDGRGLKGRGTRGILALHEDDRGCRILFDSKPVTMRLNQVSSRPMLTTRNTILPGYVTASSRISFMREEGYQDGQATYCYLLRYAGRRTEGALA